MKVGDLVTIKRAGIGVPEDTLGLIIRCSSTSFEGPEDAPNRSASGISIFEVQICDVSPLGTHRIVRRIGRDLEVVNKGS